MSRRRYLVTYDVADDKRRAELFELCRQHGDHTQYSVFLAELNSRELVAFQAAADAIIHHQADQVLIADLGPALLDAGRIIASLGRAYSPPVRVIVV